MAFFRLSRWLPIEGAFIFLLKMTPFRFDNRGYIREIFCDLALLRHSRCLPIRRIIYFNNIVCFFVKKFAIKCEMSENKRERNFENEK